MLPINKMWKKICLHTHTHKHAHLESCMHTHTCLSNTLTDANAHDIFEHVIRSGPDWDWDIAYVAICKGGTSIVEGSKFASQA